MYSAAPVAKVGPLAMVSGLPIVREAWQYFPVWLAGHLLSGLFGIMIPHPTPCLIYLVSWGCYGLPCLQSSSLNLFASCCTVVFFFIPLFQRFSLLLFMLLLLLVYFNQLPLVVFQCDRCPYFVLSYFFAYPFIGVGACGWVVDTAGHVAGSILQGLDCWPTVGLF